MGAWSRLLLISYFINKKTHFFLFICLFFYKFQSTFHYDSQLWSNRVAYNLPGGKTGFDSQETKLPTYWNTSFSFSLYSLIADGQYRHTTLGPGTWKTLVGSQASLQPHCTKEGFSAVGDNTSIQNKNRHHR